MEPEVALIGPPRTLPIGENIHGTNWSMCSCCRAVMGCYGIQRYILCRCIRVKDTIYRSHAGNADNLVGIDEVRVRDVVVGCQTPPVCAKTACNPTQCIPTNNYICAVTARADGLRLRMRASHIQAQSDANAEHSEHRSNTELPYKTYCTKLLEILPDSLVFSQITFPLDFDLRHSQVLLWCYITCRCINTSTTYVTETTLHSISHIK